MFAAAYTCRCRGRFASSTIAANVIRRLLGDPRLTTSEFSRLSLPQTAFGAGFAPDSRRLSEKQND
jgi:hypothetical protein